MRSPTLRSRTKARRRGRASSPRLADLYALVHREAGPVAAFLTLEEARHEFMDMLCDEPDWIGDVWIEPFSLRVTEEEHPPRDE